MATQYEDYSEPGTYPKVMGSKKGYAEAGEAYASRQRADALRKYSQEQQRKALFSIKKKFEKEAIADSKSTKSRAPRRAPKARKTSFAKGALALAGAFGVPTGVGPQGGVSQGQGRVKQGRGRPSGTFTPRFLPGVGMVKMPIQAYKRALSAAKAKIRYQQELKQARFAAQPPMDHTGRGQQGEFAYADGPEDYDMEQEMMPQQQMPMQQRRPGVAQRVSNWVAQRRMAQQMQQGYPGQPGQPGRITLMQGQPQAQRMNVWGGGSMMGQNNILNSPNIFNNPGQTSIGIPRRRTI